MRSCLLLLALAACQAPSGPSAEADIAAIRAVSDARAEAFCQGNAQGIAAHFSEDAFLMAPGTPSLRGPAAVAAYYQQLFDQYAYTGLRSGYEAVEVDGDLAFGRGFAELALLPRSGGDTLRSRAKYLNILRRQPDGSWKTTHDIWNGDAD
jgi:uncharacterized protein (TIGR02246 family)